MKTGMKLAIIALFGMMLAMGSGCGPAPAGNVNKPPGQLPPGQLPVCGEPTEQQICVTVDYRRTLAEMIQAGKYDKILGSEYLVEENFPIQRPSGGGSIVKVELILVFGYGDDLGRSHTLSDVVEYFDAHPELRYARIEEILALGEQYPNFQLSLYGGGIISLSSFFTVAPDGHHYVSFLGSYVNQSTQNPTLNRSFGGQYMESDMLGYGQFSSYTIFPAVRK